MYIQSLILFIPLKMSDIIVQHKERITILLQKPQVIMFKPLHNVRLI